jgi:hypothetical protein
MELTDKLGADTVIDFVNAAKSVETDIPKAILTFYLCPFRINLLFKYGGKCC